MIGPRPDDGPVVFVGALDRFDLDPADDHHLRRVVRLRDGSPICVGDGAGSWRRAVLASEGRWEPMGPPMVEDPPPREVGVAFALTKHDKPDLVVQKLTEIGVDRITLFAGGRSVVRWDPERRRRAEERLQRVSRAACAQSRRSRWADVRWVDDVGSVIEGVGVARADLDGGAWPPGVSTLLVGPEGGWSPAERSWGIPSVSLGPNVLRAETAAIVAGALLVAARGLEPNTAVQ